jgi:Zinc dependent phospholipase C
MHQHHLSGAASRSGRCQVPRKLASLVPLAFVLLAHSQSAEAYGVLTHQQLIDQAWKSTIAPLLLSRFPSLTPEELTRAHAYAYGGCVIQDLGYYPFSNVFFSNLTHYVRSGDFVRSLFRNAHTADEAAFAIGALAHYIGDSIGHSQATNPSVAMAFPKLEKKYGPSVNYAEGKNAHGQVEFAFDINQAAKRHLAPYDYVQHVGLDVSWSQLAAAFHETYGFPISELLGHYHNALRSYRFGARRFLPELAYAEVLLHRHSFPAETPNPQFELYQQRTSQLAREAEWDSYRRNPGAGTHLLAGLIVILPKIGPIKMLSIKGPTVSSESLYIESVNLSTTALNLALRQLGAPEPPAATATDRAITDTVRQQNAALSAAIAPGQPQVAAPPVRATLTLPSSLVPDRDLDTGQRVVPGGYLLTDQTYVRLLDRVTRDPAQVVPAGLKRDILDYYAGPDAPISTKRDTKKWALVQKQLQILSGMPARPDADLP